MLLYYKSCINQVIQINYTYKPPLVNFLFKSKNHIEIDSIILEFIMHKKSEFILYNTCIDELIY